MPAKRSLQALILCGPGSSFPTFTANPDEHPKALLSVANRPMVWYPLRYCYSMGIKNITLICPPSAANAVTTAMNLNPHLTSLPSPKPLVLAPEGLDYNTSTANILRHGDVQALVETDFLVLPCDIICEVPGHKLWSAWRNLGVSLAAILGTDSLVDGSKPHASGGLSVWYDTKAEPVVKGEETDFAALVGLVPSSPRHPETGSLVPHVSRLVYALPGDTLSDIKEDKDGLPVRHGLMRAHPRANMRATLRDAHIYLFPHWVMDLVAKNDRLETIGEDVIGWWAKAGWMPGLDDKLGLPGILADVAKKWTPAPEEDEYADSFNRLRVDSPDDGRAGEEKRTQEHSEEDGKQLRCPPILAYVHPKAENAPIIRRIDTAPLLLNVSLQLAKLPSLEEVAAAVGGGGPGVQASPYAHARKVAYPEGVRQRTTITQADSLIAEQVIVEEKVAVRESVVGAGCTLREGAKLTRCVLMDGVVVGRFSRLTGCILGKRARIGDNVNLTDCEVQENLFIVDETEEKGEKLRSAQHLEATEEEMNEVLDEAGVST